MKNAFLVLVCLPFIFLTTQMFHKSITFNVECSGRLKRAADANTVELAKSELEVAINYARSKGLTSGTTSIWWETPSTDLGFWFKNLEGSLAELNNVGPSQLERTNVLMKLRETLLDHGKDGDDVTHPAFISLYPNGVMIISSYIMATLVTALAICFKIGEMVDA